MAKPAIRGVTGLLQHGGDRRKSVRGRAHPRYRYKLEQRESEIIEELRDTQDMDPMEVEDLECELIWEYNWTPKAVDHLLGRDGSE